MLLTASILYQPHVCSMVHLQNIISMATRGPGTQGEEECAEVCRLTLQPQSGRWQIHIEKMLRIKLYLVVYHCISLKPCGI